jgi:hypothetical protein
LALYEDYGIQVLIGFALAAGIILGGLGAILGAMGWRRHRRLGERLEQIEEQRKAERTREAQRAKLRARIEQQVDVKSYLIIENDGPGDAANLTVSINGSPISNCPAVSLDPSDLSRIHGVKAQDRLRIPIKPSPELQTLHLDLTWSDASGELGFYKTEFDR